MVYKLSPNENESDDEFKIWDIIDEANGNYVMDISLDELSSLIHQSFPGEEAAWEQMSVQATNSMSLVPYLQIWMDIRQ